RGRQIKLFVPDVITNSLNLEPAALLVIQNCSKDTRRVEVGVAIPVDRAVHADQSNGAHVADDSVVFDRLIRHQMARCSFLDSNSRWCVSDPLPPSAALPLVRGRRERSERGGRSHTILDQGMATAPRC